MKEQGGAFVDASFERVRIKFATCINCYLLHASPDPNQGGWSDIAARCDCEPGILAGSAVRLNLPGRPI